MLCFARPVVAATSPLWVETDSDAAACQNARRIPTSPVRKLENLREFNAKEFVDALFE